MADFEAELLAARRREAERKNEFLRARIAAKRRGERPMLRGLNEEERGAAEKFFRQRWARSVDKGPLAEYNCNRKVPVPN